jgi:hypothetical protein
MEYCNDFRTDLKFGQENEKKIAEKIFNIPIESIEAKEDKLANATGNFFIEYESRGKPSGIATTQADVWFYTISESAGGLFLYTKELKEIVEFLKPTHTRLGGDDNTSKGILISFTDFFKVNIRRHNLLKNLRNK